MALFFRLNNSTTKPEGVWLDMQIHDEVMRTATLLDCKIIMKMSDHFADASFEVDEISSLTSELENIKNSVDERYKKTINDIISVCLLAVKNEIGLKVYAE